jgi:hypothetical protein
MNQDNLEKYLNGTMDTEELNHFKALLITDDQLVKDVFEQKMLQEAVQQYEQLNALYDLLTDIQQQRTDRNKRSYTLDELLEMFEPSAYYEEEFAATRSAIENALSISVTAPAIDADCIDKIDFVFDPPLVNDTVLSIENNREEPVVAEQNIAKKSANACIDIAHLLPGRYYWKLDNNSDMIIGGFYVQKNMMPNGK